MAGVHEADVMRAALERTVVTHFHPAEGLPALQRILRKLEGAVLDELGVEAAVGRVVDVLEEDAVHGRLDGRSDLLEVDVHPMRLGECGHSDQKGRNGEKNAVANHHVCTGGEKRRAEENGEEQAVKMCTS